MTGGFSVVSTCAMHNLQFMVMKMSIVPMLTKCLSGWYLSPAELRTNKKSRYFSSDELIDHMK